MPNKALGGVLGHLSRVYMPLLRGTHTIVFTRCFRLWERLGFHITPRHYYQPVPAVAGLRPELWSRESLLGGIDMNVERQFELLHQFSASFKDEYDKIPRNKTRIPYEYYLYNESFECVDAEVLYCMIRHFKPKKMIEVGSGYSTYLSAQALLKNKQETNRDAELIALEPYPNDSLKSGFPGLSRLMQVKAEDVDLAQFSELRENDILFIDSSHVLTIGNDVQRLYLDVLPSLNKGVIVHIHDIFLPREYPKDWVLRNYRFWNEQYLLQAFLAFNHAFEVLWAGHFMHVRHPEILEKGFGSYNRAAIGPGSFWIRKTK